MATFIDWNDFFKLSHVDMITTVENLPEETEIYNTDNSALLIRLENHNDSEKVSSFLDIPLTPELENKEMLSYAVGICVSHQPDFAPDVPDDPYDWSYLFQFYNSPSPMPMSRSTAYPEQGQPQGQSDPQPAAELLHTQAGKFMRLRSAGCILTAGPHLSLIHI